MHGTFDGKELGQAIVESVKAYVDRTVNARCAALETKIALLEQRDFSYQGVWKDGKIYGVGQFVTYDGSLWHSNIFHNTQQPGNGNAAWTLCVRRGERGRDGKDARGAA